MGCLWSKFSGPREASTQQLGARVKYTVEKRTPSPKRNARYGSGCQGTTGGMSQRCRLALQKSHTEITEDLNITRTIDLLFSKFILTQEDKQKIQETPTDHGKRRTLLDLLAQKGQSAYDEFCECLSTDQPWLRESLEQNYKSITDADLAKMQQRDDLGKERLTEELEEALKYNLSDKLKQWKTALEEGVLDQEGRQTFIDQPCTVNVEGTAQQTDLHGVIQLIEESVVGDRIVILGGAGMGKTTLLKHIAHSWIENSNVRLAEKFKFVFLIPMHLVGNISLLNIICDELKLMPMSNMEDVKKSLDRNERNILFLLDSFEELRGDIVAEDTEIHDLIKGKLFPRSTVIVTSRPGSLLSKYKRQKTAQLKDFPEAEVKEIIRLFFGSNAASVAEVLGAFPAMSFLQKPINLALFLFVIRQSKDVRLSYTQAELFSLMLQYIMLAYAKKKKLTTFTVQPGPYLLNKQIPKDIRRLFKDIAKKCFEEKMVNSSSMVLHVEDSDDLREYLDFGLFTPGPNTNTVILPHPLFLEHFAGAHLAEDHKAWGTFFEQIRRKCEDLSPRSSLTDVVRPMGLENVVRFVVAMGQESVIEQIGSLFALKRGREAFCCGSYQIYDFSYYQELLRDCYSPEGKRILATALLNAPVIDGGEIYGLGAWRGASPSVLLPYLNFDQCVTFLKKVYDLDLCVKDGKSAISCTGDTADLGITDTFIPALVYRYDCNIKAKTVSIGGLDLPAALLSRNLQGVHQMKLTGCRVCEGMPDYMPEMDMQASLQKSSQCRTNSSLERIRLQRVKGLEHCDVITSRECHLEMHGCDDVRVSTLRTCFPKISELTFKYNLTTVVYESEDELTSWLTTVKTVRRLELAPQDKGEALNLCRLLNVLSEKRNGCLVLSKSAVSLVAMPVKANALGVLVLKSCFGIVDLCQLLLVCSQCQQLEMVAVEDSNLVCRTDKVEFVKPLTKLQRMTLESSVVRTQDGRTLEVDEVKQCLKTLCPSAEIVVKVAC